MKTKTKKSRTRLLCLSCLLCCAFTVKMQPPMFPPFENNKAIPFVARQMFLTESPSDILPSSAYLASAFPDTGSVGKNITNSEKSLLFEAPEGGGIPLGTPVKGAMLFLICLVVLYGIVNRQKQHPNN
jgi:hypothetical protein